MKFNILTQFNLFQYKNTIYFKLRSTQFLFCTQKHYLHSTSYFKKDSNLKNTINFDEETNQKLRLWLNNFKEEDVPFEQFTKSFQRSSGPGGQNVNKVASKVELRFNLYQAKWLPKELKTLLINVPPYSSRTNKLGELVITSDTFRTQNQNLLEAQRKLICLIQSLKNLIPTPPSQEAIDRATKRKQKGDKLRHESKLHQKDKKQSRKVSRDWN